MNKRQIAALVVVLGGGAFAVLAHGYPQGSLLRPGPGFLPFNIGILIAALGVAILIEELRAARHGDKPAPEPGSLRAVLAISAGMIALALLLERAGFIPAMAAMFVIVGLAEPGRNWAALAISCLLMAVFGTVLFIWLLGVPVAVLGPA
ncbi:MAG: tripartite tricarboxylate transporter TctB family protein [Pseudomonadota bacterium]|nr:tripartite tricarboxylate transporter TctB family protein [Pseudomonadota bacterium]